MGTEVGPTEAFVWRMTFLAVHVGVAGLIVTYTRHVVGLYSRCSGSAPVKQYHYSSQIAFRASTRTARDMLAFPQNNVSTFFLLPTCGNTGCSFPGARFRLTLKSVQIDNAIDAVLGTNKPMAHVDAEYDCFEHDLMPEVTGQ